MKLRIARPVLATNRPREVDQGRGPHLPAASRPTVSSSSPAFARPPGSVRSLEPMRVSRFLPLSGSVPAAKPAKLFARADGPFGRPTGLTLLLLVLGVLADHHDISMPLDDLALFTDRLHRRTHLHEEPLLSSALLRPQAGTTSAQGFCYGAKLYLKGQKRQRTTRAPGSAGRLRLKVRSPILTYLNRYTILPRVRSYGESSTVTRSPGKMRMKFMRILPDT